VASLLSEPLAFVPTVLPAQAGSNMIVNGAIFAVLAGAVIFAVCRSSNRN
jgi:hypothetical protein